MKQLLRLLALVTFVVVMLQSSHAVAQVGDSYSVDIQTSGGPITATFWVAAGPKLNVYPSHDDQDLFLQALTVDISRNSYDPSKTPDAVVHLIRQVYAGQVLSSTNIVGLWNGSLIDPQDQSVPAPFYPELGQKLWYVVQLYDKAQRLTMANTIALVTSSNPSVMPNGSEDFGKIPKYTSPRFSGWSFGADNVPNTGDDFIIGTGVDSKVRVNFLVAAFYAGTVTVDAQAGNSNQEKLATALALFANDVTLKPQIQFWLGDTRTDAPYVADGETFNITLKLKPIIIASPSPVEVREGWSASFSAATTGPNLSYQWQYNDVNVQGATAPTFTIPAVGYADAGNYRVVVSNDNGFVTSNEALLTVTVPPLPIPTTGAVTGLTATSAILNGTVDTQQESTTAWIEVAQNEDYTDAVSTPIETFNASGAISATVALSAETLYHFRVGATNRVGSTYSNDTVFTTPKAVIDYSVSKGMYNGLITDPTDSQSFSGKVGLTVRQNGIFTGALWYLGKRYEVLGQLDSFGDGNFVIAKGSKTFQSASLTLHLRVSGIEGSLSFTDFGGTQYVSAFHADRPGFSSAKPSPWFGWFNLQVSSPSTPSQSGVEIPFSNGTAKLYVSKRGTMRLAGRLPDGTHISNGGALSSIGAVPIFKSLYRVKGVVAGYLQLLDPSLAKVDGDWLWIKPQQNPRTVGFRTTLGVVGQR